MSDYVDTPRVIAHRDGAHLVIRCPFCHKRHHHGAGTGGPDAYGHRVAHCGDGPGYVLVPEVDHG